MFNAWRKSSYSFANGNCAEVAAGAATVLVRDSKMDGAGPVLRFSAGEWNAFLATVKQRQGS